MNVHSQFPEDWEIFGEFPEGVASKTERNNLRAFIRVWVSGNRKWRTRELVHRLNAYTPMLEALKLAEWNGKRLLSPCVQQDVCPICGHTELQGHKPDCKLAAAIRMAEEGTPNERAQ